MWSRACSLFHMPILSPKTINHLGIPILKLWDIEVLDFHFSTFATNLLIGSSPLNLMVYEDI